MKRTFFLFLVLLGVESALIPNNNNNILSSELKADERVSGPRFGRLSKKLGSVDVVYGMIERVLGQQHRSSFVLTLQSNMGADLSETGQELDMFQLKASPVGGPVVINGNSAVALSMGVMYYLKKYSHLSMTWGYQNDDSSWSCDNMYLPSPVPAVTVTETVQSPYPFRYYMNVCTVSYSMVWWNWTRWEREIDWMALSGINLPLAFTGQEYIWAKVFADLGVNETSIETFFSGPAFLAWQRMGNVQGWAGPLLPSWREQQATLQKQILARMREFGMIPVLGAFAGHIPSAIATLFPNANVTTSAPWGNFQSPYSSVYLLSPFDPLFQKIGVSFMKYQSEEFGFGEHIYNCDTFNEMDPSSNDTNYLKSYSAAVYNAMYSFDPDAVWLMQGWLFHSSFWNSQTISSYLSGVADDRMIILDLNSEQSPLWTDFVQNNKSFIWCLLHNYGGMRDLHGNISLVSTNPILAKNSAKSLMMGTGITMEAIEQNPIMYELMNEMGYRSELFNSNEWVQDYIFRRYNGTSTSMEKSWNLLIPSAYNRGFSWLGGWIGTDAPRLNMGYDLSQNVNGILNSWKLFLQASNEFNFKSGGWHYDLVDLTRQVIVNFHYDVYKGLEKGIKSCINQDERVSFVDKDTWDLCHQSFVNHSYFMTIMMDRMESILSTDINYLLGQWLESAKSWGNTEQEKQILEFNARNQITLWGPNGNINDYAAKCWSGLVGTYYKERWSMFYSYLNIALLTQNSTVDWNDLSNKLIELGNAWDEKRDLFPTKPQGDALEIAKSIQAEYSKMGNYSKSPNMVPSPNANIIRTAWTSDVAQLSILCDLEPTCAGFCSNGQLYTQGTTFVVSDTYDTYNKQV
eukprot:c21253_g1_i1.p1 GENE.c21253_g1_i1~~c21253_g1_i1.p1  ORF type:complete len:856 (+),score=345.19 c21253_g1_i1:18-2585(+)